jgi:twin BRCT domain
VTNYTGEAREYLKKLITAMGAQFTPSMSGRNTVLVAAQYGRFRFRSPQNLIAFFQSIWKQGHKST